MIKIRLLLTTTLIWAASRVCPREMRNVVRVYADLLDSFPDNLKEGREGGLITTCWAINERGHRLAQRQQDAALAACRVVRERFYRAEGA